MFCKEGVLRDFAIFTGKNLSLFTGLQACNFIRKRHQHFFTVKFAKFLRTHFLRNISSGCFWYDSETYNMVKLICLLILISFQFKLHMILINLIKVNHLTYCVQEKIPKIKRFQYVKSYLFICLFSNNMN